MDLLSMIQHYCAYQERSQKEVRNKLYEKGADSQEVATLTAQLIEENFLNEERFAQAFARGKFKIKNWGRRKIVYELKLHQISEYCIRKALSEIDEEEYYETIIKLSEKKMPDILKSQNVFSRRTKLQRYLQQKGFEQELIAEMLKKFI